MKTIQIHVGESVNSEDRQQPVSDLGFAGIDVRIDDVEPEPSDWIPEEEYQKMINILTEVSVERKRIFSKYGTRNFPPLIWSPILNEEVGEYNKDLCELTFTNNDVYRSRLLKNMRTELIQIAAVAVAMIESLDRNELKYAKR